MQEKQGTSDFFVVIACLFVSSLLLSNIIAGKLILIAVCGVAGGGDFVPAGLYHWGRFDRSIWFSKDAAGNLDRLCL